MCLTVLYIDSIIVQMYLTAASGLHFSSQSAPTLRYLCDGLEIKEHKQGLEKHKTKYRPRDKTASESNAPGKKVEKIVQKSLQIKSSKSWPNKKSADIHLLFREHLLQKQREIKQQFRQICKRCQSAEKYLKSTQKYLKLL